MGSLGGVILFSVEGDRLSQLSPLGDTKMKLCYAQCPHITELVGDKVVCQHPMTPEFERGWLNTSCQLYGRRAPYENPLPYTVKVKQPDPTPPPAIAFTPTTPPPQTFEQHLLTAACGLRRLAEHYYNLASRAYVRFTSQRSVVWWPQRVLRFEYAELHVMQRHADKAGRLETQAGWFEGVVEGRR